MTANKYIETQITVKGALSFPFEMLHYDNCVPADTSDVERMLWFANLIGREVRLRRFSVDGQKATANRWKSFHWDVIEDSGK